MRALMLRQLIAGNELRRPFNRRVKTAFHP
jgi:hypothetical protein